MKIKVIACEVMKEEIQGIEPLADQEFEFVSMDFHLYPEKLGAELQKIIDRSLGYDRIILAFGLCGGATRGLMATHSRITLPKVHDCIPLFLCSDKCRLCDFKSEMGTFYLSNGWMITEKSILSEHQRVLKRFGSKKALSVLHRTYEGYKKVLFITTGSHPQDEVIEQSKEIAQLFNAEYKTVQGETAFFEKIVRGPWDDVNFINIPQSGMIKEEDFGINAK
ncbi:DUF1638 domain-containing protein [Acetobacterium sp.]|uniref:DUF1638 domain-containing protein n=1 Tax=Acetobacterium sp. TaxID=1872094 RepID=UPI002F42A6F9